MSEIKKNKPNNTRKAAHKAFPKISKWKPKKSQEFVECDGKLLICHFDKIFGLPNLAVYNKFMVRRVIFTSQLPLISRYINYFMNTYDSDNELAGAYIKMKYSIDKEREFNLDNMDALIDFLYEVLFTPTMVEKIEDLVNENYDDDIENNGNQKKYQKNDKKHLESLEFTNQHVRILLAISFGIKLMAPVILHFFALNVLEANKNEMDDILFKFFYRLFDIFGYDETYTYMHNDEEVNNGITEDFIYEKLDNGEVYVQQDPQDYNRVLYIQTDDNSYYYRKSKINLYNKLYVYVKAKVLESNSNNSLIFGQREIFGDDIYTVISNLTKHVLVAENLFKYEFGQNVIGFNKVIIRCQLSYYLKARYDKNITEVTNAKNSEGLSGMDKMEMNLTKLDEGTITTVDINIDKTFEKIKKLIDIDVTEEEIDYYREHLKLSDLQRQLIYAYYGKYFGSVRDLNLITARQYIHLALLLKKKLLIHDSVYESVLPYILTGNSEDRVNTRLIRNHKFINKVEDSSLYQKLVNGKYRFLCQIKPDYILTILSTLINTRFSYVTYEKPELLGTEIVYSEDKISDELLSFLNSI